MVKQIVKSEWVRWRFVFTCVDFTWNEPEIKELSSAAFECVCRHASLGRMNASCLVQTG